MATPEYQIVGVKPTSRHCGNTRIPNRRGQTDLTSPWQHQNTKPSGSNRPHGTVVKTQNIQTVRVKPTSRQRGKNPEYPTVGIKPTSRQRGKNSEYPTVGIKPTSRHRGKNSEYPTVGIKPTSRHRGKNPEYPTVGIKPTSRQRGKKTQNTQLSGSNRPHVNVVKTQCTTI